MGSDAASNPRCRKAAYLFTPRFLSYLIVREPNTGLRFDVSRESLLIALVLFGLCVLSAGWIVSLGCQPVGREPTIVLSVQGMASADGLELNVTHDGGDAVEASDIYVRTSTTNASFAELSPQYESEAVFGGGGHITLSGFSEGTHVEIAWFDPSLDYAGDDCVDSNPYTRVLAEFTVGNSSTYPQPR